MNNLIYNIKGYTDLEQSRKLAEILPLKSADSHYVRNTHDFMGNPIDGKWSHPKYGNPNSKYAHYVIQNFSNYEIIPCWSLAALTESITKIKQGGIFYNLTYDFILNKWTMDIEDDNWREDVDLYDNLVDACVAMIEKLHELKLL